jgi:rRNA maturation protein Nop10
MATKTKKTWTGRYKRCPKCQARLSRSSESCRYCGHSTASSLAPPPFVPTETQQMLRQLAEGSPVRSPERFDVTGRYLVIVNRDHRDLYGYLKTAFSGEPGVQVIQERRTTERRGKSGKAPLDRRRRGDRRKRPDGEAEVRKYGVAVVRTI